jgi:hypothetical protein
VCERVAAAVVCVQVDFVTKGSVTHVHGRAGLPGQHADPVLMPCNADTKQLVCDCIAAV